MKKIYSKFDKLCIPKLPQALFKGRIETILSESEAEKAVDYLLRQDIIGFDTETKPMFKAGRQNEVALLQVSSRDICFLFRLNHIGLPACLIRLLSDSSNVKVGLSWHDDLRMLQRRTDFVPGKFVELQEMACDYGIKDLSLQKLYANIFGEKISKSQRLSNWEADILSEPQKLYAATDAWACVMLYQELIRLKEEGYELEIVPEPEVVAPKEGESKKKKPAKEKPKKEPKAKEKNKKSSSWKHRKVKKKSTENKDKDIKPNEQVDNTP